MGCKEPQPAVHSIPDLTPEETISIAVELNYVENCMQRAQDTSALSHFEFTHLPAEIQMIIIDQVVLAAVNAADASRRSLKARRLSWSTHEVWLVALETLKNLVAAELYFGALIFDAVKRVHPLLADAGHFADDCISDILYAARLQICVSHGEEILRAKPVELRALRKMPVLGRDLYKLAPAPATGATASKAWDRLYTESKTSTT